MFRSLMLPLLAASLLAAVAPVRADTVYLVNGDTIRGEVLSLDAKELKLKGELLGTLTIPRDKIGAIALGDRPLPGGAAPKDAAAGGESSASVKDQLQSSGIDPQQFRAAERLAPGAMPAQPGSAEEAIGQLRAQGIDPSVKKQIEQAFPLLGSSEAGDYFNSTITGLASGQLNLEDLRRDAQKARDQILDLQRDMDPQAQSALAPYLNILNRFLQQTEPASETPAEKAP